MEAQMNRLFLSVIFIIIGVVLLTSFATTIHDSTVTTTGGALENVSANAKTLYGFYDLIWAALGLVFIIGGGWSAVATVKKG